VVGISSTWDKGEDGFKANPVVPWLGVRKVGEFFLNLFLLFSIFRYSRNH